MRKQPAGAHTQTAAQAGAAVRRGMALRATAFAKGARPIDTKLERSEQYCAPDGPFRSTLVEFGNRSVLAGFDADEHTHRVHCWLHSSKQNENLAGVIRWEGSDHSCAGAIAELDGLIDAALHLRAALVERAEADGRLAGE